MDDRTLGSVAVPIEHGAKELSVDVPVTAMRTGVPEFSDLILACRHHRARTALMGTLLSVVFMATAAYVTKATYQAESLVRVRQHQDVVYSPLTSRADDAAFVRSQEQLALSPQVLTAAYQSQRVQSEVTGLPEMSSREVVEWLASLLRVDIQIGSEVMSISAIHPSPRMAHAVSLAVTDAYLNEVNMRESLDRQRRQTELESAAQAADARLDAVWEELNRVAKQVGSDSSQSLTLRDELQLQAYRDYAQQLRTAQQRGIELQRQLSEERIRLSSDALVAESSSDALLQSHPEIVRVREHLAKIDEQVQLIREVAAVPDSPRVTRLLQDRDDLTRRLSELLEVLVPQTREQSREQERQKKVNALSQLEKQIESNQAERMFLESRLAEIDTRLVRADDEGGVQLEVSRHAVERQSRLADNLWQSLEELKIESHSQPRVTLLEYADYPFNANHSRQLKTAATGAALAWIVVILGVGYYEWNSCRIRSSDDVARVVSRPVFGAASFNAPARNAVAAESQAARETAARLMLTRDAERSIPSLMVCSVEAGEPAFGASLDLARAFVDYRRRTLLIDCDITSQDMGVSLGMAHLPGILQFKPSQRFPKHLLVPSNHASLDLLPLGVMGKDSAWLDPQILRATLDQLRGDYEAIVVNGPPMLTSADSLLLSAHVDQTLFVATAGITRWNRLASAERYVLSAEIPVLGTLLRRSAAADVSWVSVYMSRPLDLGSADADGQDSDEAEESLLQGLTDLHEVANSALDQAASQKTTALNDERVNT